jgi:hypothetical protein
MRSHAWLIGVLAGLGVFALTNIFLWTPLVVLLALMVGVKAGMSLESSDHKQIGI